MIKRHGEFLRIHGQNLTLPMGPYLKIKNEPNWPISSKHSAFSNIFF